MNCGIKTIGNATLIAFDEVPILSTDPWLENKPAYFGSWTLPYSIPDEEFSEIKLSKYIWFSHGHPDHINPDSLNQFRESKILLSDHVGNRIKDNLTKLGMEVYTLPDRKWTNLSERIKVYSIADFSQNSILLVDVNSYLFVNLNDAPERWWGHTVKKIIKNYKKSYLMQLTGSSDADMVNFYDEDGNHIPKLPKTKGSAGKDHHAGAKKWGTSAVIPFSSFHKYQRSDTAWLNDHILTPDDHYIGFPKNSSIEYIDPFISINCLNGKYEKIKPPPTPIKNL